MKGKGNKTFWDIKKLSFPFSSQKFVTEARKPAFFGSSLF